jgi:hypothetical protein
MGGCEGEVVFDAAAGGRDSECGGEGAEGGDVPGGRSFGEAAGLVASDPELEFPKAEGCGDFEVVSEGEVAEPPFAAADSERGEGRGGDGRWEWGRHGGRGVQVVCLIKRWVIRKTRGGGHS